MRFRKNNQGKLWGAFQMLFWVILIPLCILAMPLDLYFEKNAASVPLDPLYSFLLLDWRLWALSIIGIVFLLISIEIVRLGWRQMHPEGQVPKEIQEAREKFAQGFSKEEFLAKLKKGTL